VQDHDELQRQRLRELVEDGKDPAEVINPPEPATPEADADEYTVAQLAKDYMVMADKMKRASSVRNDTSMIAKTIEPALGKMAVADIKRRDVEKMFHAVVQVVLDPETLERSQGSRSFS
jgi:Phage integrase, N-terminal SAM-like domain